MYNPENEYYKTLNEDRIKPILNELGIMPIESWKNYQLRIRKTPIIIYYYVFKIRDIAYCVCADDLEIKLVDEYRNILYCGFEEKELKKEIKKIMEDSK